LRSGPLNDVAGQVCLGRAAAVRPRARLRTGHLAGRHAHLHRIFRVRGWSSAIDARRPCLLPMAQQVALLSPTHASAPHGVRCACRLDEVAEILASPFGNDPNHIDLGPEALNLIDDLEIMFEKHDMPIGEVLTGTTNEHAFSQLGLTPVRRHRLQPY
jgi:hypothetical protein